MIITNILNAVIAIYIVATKPKSKKMNCTIHYHAQVLIDTWKRLFGWDHVMSKSSIILKLRKIIDQ